MMLKAAKSPDGDEWVAKRSLVFKARFRVWKRDYFGGDPVLSVLFWSSKKACSM